MTLRGHDNSVRTLAFSPDAKLLASGSFDNNIKLWNL
jgi:WD40 repeat protein